MNKVAAIVVTYNRKKLLLENIHCLLLQSVKSELDIIVIDNASTDGTETALQSLVKQHKIIYLNTGSNLGGAGGFQYGIKYAAEHKYAYIWVMDDDCMPTNTALEVFLKYDHLLNGNYGFLSSQVKWRDDTICTMNVQRQTLFKNVCDFTSDLVSIKMASFVSLFLPTAIVMELGLPIKEFLFGRMIGNIPEEYLNDTDVT
jgi:GT2 family glycosyltransferase